MIITNHLNAERSVLSTLMLYNDNYDLISNLLKVDDFEATSHQKIYQYIVELADKSLPFDLVMIDDLLVSRDSGAEYNYLTRQLAEISTAATATPRALVSHAELIRTNSLRRKMTRALKQGIDNLGNNDAVTDVANDVVSALSGLEQSTGRKEVYSVDDMAASMIERIALAKSGVTHYIDTGFNELDRVMQMHDGDLVVIAARPSMGKSLLVVNIQSYLARVKKGASVFFSVEMNQDSVMDRLAAAECSIPMRDIKSGDLNEDQWAALQRFLSENKTSNFKVVRKTDLDVSYMRWQLNKLKREHGSISCIGVDYLQLMSGLSGDDSVKRIGDVTRNLKMLADEFDCPVILLSQLNRAVEKRPNKRPTMSDLRDSGAIEQDADIIAFIYREDYYKKMAGESDFDGMADIIVGKNRDGETDTVRLAFEGHMGRFSNLIPNFNSDDIPPFGRK